MTAVVSARPTLAAFLYPATPARPVGARAVIAWWERRRWRYNVAVGVVGLAGGLALMTVSVLAETLGRTGAIGELDGLFLPLVGVLLYGVAANVCYTAGWVVEVLANRWRPASAPHLGPALYRAGVRFSLILTALPAALVLVVWLLRLLGVLAPPPPELSLSV